MSAKMETFFELKKVVDHDCGNYRMGEIDFVDYDKLRDHISKHGENGYSDLIETLITCLSKCQDAIRVHRARKSHDQCGDGTK